MRLKDTTMEVDEIMPWVCLLNGKTPALKMVQGLSLPSLEKKAELVLCRWHQHVLRGEHVVGPGGDDPDGHLELLLPAVETVDDVEPLARVQVIHRVPAVGEEGLVVMLDVDLAPPYVVGGYLLEHDPLITGTKKCVSWNPFFRTWI